MWLKGTVLYRHNSNAVRLSSRQGAVVALLVVAGLTLACGSAGGQTEVAPTPTASLNHATATAVTMASEPTAAPGSEVRVGTPTPAPSATPSAIPATATPPPTATPLAEAPTEGIRVGQHPYSTTVQVSGGGTTRSVVVNYLLYLPPDYGQDRAQRWPLILFLHGQLEWGNDPRLLVREGLPKHLAQGQGLPAIVASPQSPEGQRWWPRAEIVGAFLDYIETHYAVDPNRVYLTGISMGAYGAWAVAMRYPQRFAALVPIAGGADYLPTSDDIPKEICQLKEVPTWVFHGRMDNNVPYTASVKAVQALQDCGGNVRFTLYPDAAHSDAWERTYADAELYQWLFAQERK